VLSTVRILDPATGEPHKLWKPLDGYQSMMDAESILETLVEAFYDDMEGPEEARIAILRDIRALEENGETFWEDLVGPMAEDIPWSRNTQHHLIQLLRNQFDLRGNGFAKGGMVKKKRKAKKPTMALVVTRKNPGLAEMAYRYGGMVR